LYHNRAKNMGKPSKFARANATLRREKRNTIKKKGGHADLKKGGKRIHAGLINPRGKKNR